MKILLTNDDGIYFPGHLALREELDKIGETWSFAPMSEKSGTGQALSIFDDVLVKKIDKLDRCWMVEGYPADCVNIGLYSGLVDIKNSPQKNKSPTHFKKKFDLVISGINKGFNMGQDVLYSGTVGAALHGYVHRYPALAVSCGFQQAEGNYEAIAILVREFIETYQNQLFEPSCINMNIPVEVPKSKNGIPSINKIKWTKLGTRIYRDIYKKTYLNDSSMYLNLGGSELGYLKEYGTDFAAVEKGFISVTPLSIHQTQHEQLKRYRSIAREKKITQSN